MSRDLEGGLEPLEMAQLDPPEAVLPFLDEFADRTLI
jgi:hypothetical protein